MRLFFPFCGIVSPALVTRSKMCKRLLNSSEPNKWFFARHFRLSPPQRESTLAVEASGLKILRCIAANSGSLAEVTPLNGHRRGNQRGDATDIRSSPYVVR